MMGDLPPRWEASAHSLCWWRHRYHEYHAGIRHGADQGNRNQKGSGARTPDVMIQFLTESAILSAFGGILGVVIGAGLVMAGGALFGLSVVVKPQVVLVGGRFSALVGLFFGLYPASKAAKKTPLTRFGTNKKFRNHEEICVCGRGIFLYFTGVSPVLNFIKL